MHYSIANLCINIVATCIILVAYNYISMPGISTWFATQNYRVTQASSTHYKLYTSLLYSDSMVVGTTIEGDKHYVYFRDMIFCEGGSFSGYKAREGHQIPKGPFYMSLVFFLFIQAYPIIRIIIRHCDVWKINNIQDAVYEFVGFIGGHSLAISVLSSNYCPTSAFCISVEPVRENYPYCPRNDPITINDDQIAAMITAAICFGVWITLFAVASTPWFQRWKPIPVFDSLDPRKNMFMLGIVQLFVLLCFIPSASLIVYSRSPSYIVGVTTGIYFFLENACLLWGFRFWKWFPSRDIQIDASDEFNQDNPVYELQNKVDTALRQPALADTLSKLKYEEQLMKYIFNPEYVKTLRVLSFTCENRDETNPYSLTTMSLATWEDLDILEQLKPDRLIRLSFNEDEPDRLTVIDGDLRSEEYDDLQNEPIITGRRKCEICYRRPLSILFLPCRHIASCFACLDKYTSQLRYRLERQKHSICRSITRRNTAVKKLVYYNVIGDEAPTRLQIPLIDKFDVECAIPRCHLCTIPIQTVILVRNNKIGIIIHTFDLTRLYELADSIEQYRKVCMQQDERGMITNAMISYDHSMTQEPEDSYNSG